MGKIIGTAVITLLVAAYGWHEDKLAKQAHQQKFIAQCEQTFTVRQCDVIWLAGQHP